MFWRRWGFIICVLVAVLLATACVSWFTSAGTYELEIGNPPDSLEGDTLLVDTLEISADSLTVPLIPNTTEPEEEEDGES